MNSRFRCRWLVLSLAILGVGLPATASAADPPSLVIIHTEKRRISSVFWTSHRFRRVREFGCERSYAASAANSLAQLAIFNGLPA